MKHKAKPKNARPVVPRVCRFCRSYLVIGAYPDPDGWTCERESYDYRSLLGKSELVKLGFSSSQRHIPGLLIPLWGVDGNGIVGYQFRPDSPRLNSKGRPVKYETPRGATNHIDCPPACQKQLADPSVLLWITEGVKKADALASQGECVVDMTGVWNWRAKNNLGGITVSSDFDSIALNSRQIFLTFDSDYVTNPSVSQAVKRLAEFLKRKKANVSIVLLPQGKNSEKIGEKGDDK